MPRLRANKRTGTDAVTKKLVDNEYMIWFMRRLAKRERKKPYGVHVCAGS